MALNRAEKLRLKVFGANVRRVRSAKGLTQERLAELASISTRNLQKVEAGQLNILPGPMSAKQFSGKFVLRVEPALHRRLAAKALAAGESLNSFCAKALIEA